MDFRVLGPFELWTTSGPVELRGDKRRGLLAYLVVHRGRPCPTDQIVDALWGEARSRGAVGTVQTYVSQIRKLLEGDAELVTGPAGYTLTIATETLDADRFELLLARAAAADDMPQRLALLDEALVLRRGPALGEFAGAPWADEAARRWDRLWVTGTEQHAEALLALGRHHDALADLERAVASDPLHERFWILLATAHYRGGDQSRALAACRDARAVLAEELGVEPGPELRALEQQILDHDESLGLVDSPARGNGRAPLPSGVVTFLITDIDKSTRLWENDTTSMAAALERHDEIIGAAVAEHGGVVFKHLGDGALAVFATPTTAVAAAVAAQRALIAEPWPTQEPVRSRMAVHTGEAVIERGGDYFGPVLNRCSRLIGLGHGGQILVTGIVADALRDHPVKEVQLEFLGEHRLRDFVQPERVAQVVHEATPFPFPPLRTIDLVGNLPPRLTALVGRDDELKHLIEIVPDQPLTTLLGPGGIGKTRLSVQVAAELEGRFDGGTWFVDLASVTDDGLVASAIASTFGLVAAPGWDIVETLEHHLAGRDALLILDNCEQIIAGAAAAVARLLRAAPDLRVLATSRQPLELGGEVVFGLGPLPVDDGGDETRSAAEQLFIERAQAVAPSFEVDAENAAIVRELCVRLEGVPLALELAAARVRSLQPADLLARLDDRFQLLRGSRRDQSDRHQTMRAAVEWSYDLLTRPQQELFLSVSVCRGGFDLAAVEALGADLDGDAVDLADDLVSRSLVIAEATESGTRFRLLETLRAYAAERLSDSGRHDIIEERHARHYLARASTPGAAADPLANDLDNLSAAVNWFVVHEPDTVARNLGDLWERYAARSRLLEVQHWLESLVDRIDASDTALVARVLERLGDACFQTGVRLEDAIAWLERALELREERGETVLAARVHVRVARNLSAYPELMDIERASRHLTAAEAILVEQGDERRLGEVHLMRASTALYARHNREGLEAARTAARLAERNGLETLRLHAQAQVGVNLGYCGDVEEAFEILERVWDDADVAGEPFARFLAAWMRGFGALLLGDPADAITWLARERARPEAELTPLQSRTMDSMLALAYMKMGDLRPAHAIPAGEVLNAPQLAPLLAAVSGEWDRAAQLLAAGRAESDHHGDRNEWSQLTLALAELQARVGETDAARDTATEALAAIREDPSPYYELPIRSLLARIGDDPSTHLAACAEIMHGHDYRGLAGTVARASAETCANAGNEDGAREHFGRALDSYRRYSMKFEEAETLASWSRVLAHFGDEQGSAARAEEWGDLLDDIGAPAWRRLLAGDPA